MIVWRIVFTQFKAPLDDSRKIILEHPGMLAVDLGPKDTLGSTRFVLQTE
jgi:hypothetical protein